MKGDEIKMVYYVKGKVKGIRGWHHITARGGTTAFATRKEAIYAKREVSKKFGRVAKVRIVSTKRRRRSSRPSIYGSSPFGNTNFRVPRMRF